MSWLYLIPAIAVVVVILLDPAALLWLAGFAMVYVALWWLADRVLGDKTKPR